MSGLCKHGNFTVAHPTAPCPQCQADETIKSLERRIKELNKEIDIKAQWNQTYFERIAELESKEDMITIFVKGGEYVDKKTFFQKRDELSQAKRRISNLEHGLRSVAQTLAWNNFGECRSFGTDLPLLSLPDADALAKELLGITE